MRAGAEHGDADGLVQLACDRTSLLSRCVAEAIRVRSPGIDVRIASADVEVPLDDGTFAAVRKVLHGLMNQLRMTCFACMILPTNLHLVKQSDPPQH